MFTILGHSTHAERFIYLSPFLRGADDTPNQQLSVKEVDTIKDSQSMTNSVTSFGSGYTQTTLRNRRRGVIEVDPNADILRLNIRVACCAIVLLQEVSFHRSVNEAVAHQFTIVIGFAGYSCGKLLG